MNKGPSIRTSSRIEKEYRTVLDAFIKRMNKDLMREITKAYARREDEFLPDEVVKDASATAWLKSVIGSFFRKWQKRFDVMAEKRASWLTEQTEKASIKQIQKMLKDIGFTVEFKNSHFVNNVLTAAFEENVALIKSIPTEMHDKVLGIVMRGVQAGNDQHFIATELQKQFGITERRARMIARDQTNKANSAISRARSAEAGIEYGFWQHRSGSKKPRPTHVKMQGKRFKLTEGLYDSAVDRYVLPGMEINCLCSYRADLSSFNPSIVQDSVSIGIRKPTYADNIERITGNKAA
jgi:SPP1 gp7 family putative phage head morphogenesis protein